VDRSKEYVKMCNWEEIQEHTPEIGDFYWEEHIDGRETIWVVFDTGNNDYQKLDWGTIWLPRQDQLQAMICPPYGKCFDVWVACNDWWHLPGTRVGYCTSMEQLWLAFVMNEKYSKQWTGTAWE